MSVDYRRDDWQVGPFHIILRSGHRDRQVGVVAWRTFHARGRWTLDVWLGSSLLTFRRRDVW